MRKPKIGNFAKIVDVDKNDPLSKYRKQLLDQIFRVDFYPPGQRAGPCPLFSGTVVLKDIPLNGQVLEIGGHICIRAKLRKVKPEKLFLP